MAFGVMCYDEVMKTRLSFIVVTSLMLGGGCVSVENLGVLGKDAWFGRPADSAAATARTIALVPGFMFTVRPSRLGVTGAVDEVFGDEERVVQVTVREARSEAFVRLDWKTRSATGTLSLFSYENAEAMLLPAFWPAGEGEIEGGGGLWMSKASFAALQNEERVELRLGLAEHALSSVSKAFHVFNTVTESLFRGSAPNLASPFQLRKTGTSDTFPLLVDGRMTLVRVVRATSWFADVFVLDNPEHPLILKVVIHPAVEPALKAFQSASVRWNELGYEITSISRL